MSWCGARRSGRMIVGAGLGIGIICGSGGASFADSGHSRGGSRIAQCGDNMSFTAILSWQEVSLGCNVLGYNDATTVSYRWTIDGTTNPKWACLVQAQALGYVKKYDNYVETNPQYHYVPTWVPAGTSTSQGGATVSWGNVAATARIRFKSDFGACGGVVIAG